MHSDERKLILKYRNLCPTFHNKFPLYFFKYKQGIIRILSVWKFKLKYMTYDSQNTVQPIFLVQIFLHHLFEGFGKKQTIKYCKTSHAC